jgi:hypothetical protein
MLLLDKWGEKGRHGLVSGMSHDLTPGFLWTVSVSLGNVKEFKEKSLF